MGGKATVNAKKLDALAKAAKAWPKGRRQMLHDNASPGGAIRVYAGGAVTLGMVARFPLHPRNPTFRAIAPYTEGSIVPWREKVREWRAAIDRGVDPRIETARQKAAERRRQVQTFPALWNACEAARVPDLVKVVEAKRAGAWWCRELRDRIAGEIEPGEISASIKTLANTPAGARNRLGHLSAAFSWAIGTGGWGVTHNPVASLRPTKLLGAKVRRQRVLSDVEMRAIWRACRGSAGLEALKAARQRKTPQDPSAPLGYPLGPLTKFLLLTGQRLQECAGLQWPEIQCASIHSIGFRWKASRG